MQHLQANTTLQGGKYRIDRMLGQGGFGITYVGYNREFEETVAIKEFFMKGVTERDDATSIVSVSNSENVPQFEEQREKFKKEARRLRKLKNEHIVKVHDLFEENGTAYYVMDYIDGESLAERMKRTGAPITESDANKILPQILDALSEVHKQEIWHLDLKPGNIMIDNSGCAYLIDFGASKQIRANGSMTTSTALCYTPGFAPTEQIGQMFDRFGPWTDIYALGATLYNILTNTKPPMTVDIEDEEEDAFDFPSSVNDDLRKLIVWMMQPKRKNRPQSVEEIKTRLTPASNKAKEQHIDIADSEETIIADSGHKLSDWEEKENKRQAFTMDGNAVDLGLKVKWADCNLGIGADMDNPAGGLYGWGDPTGEKISVETDDYMPYEKHLIDISNTKYDIVKSQWGGTWRMPTRENWNELVKKCKWLRTKVGELDGYVVIGPNNNQIFLPFTGIRCKNEITNDDAGYYWTSEQDPHNRLTAFYFYFKDSYDDEVYTRNYIYTGRAIRPVCD